MRTTLAILAALAALLVTGCSGSHWGLPVPPAPRRTPDHFRGATQMVAAAASTQTPADVPTPACLPVVIAAWWWSRRLRRRVTIRELGGSGQRQP
jgi:hypothetical protein